MPSIASLTPSTTNSTYPGPRPNSGHVLGGSSDFGGNRSPTWVQRYAESSERSKKSPRPTTPRQPWDVNDYPQVRSPEELLGGSGNPPSARERVTSSASERPPVGLGLRTNPRNSTSSAVSYFPPQASLDELTERHLKPRASSTSVGGGPMSLAQQIALDERRKKAQAELARLQADENERLKLVESNTEAEQQPIQPEARRVSNPAPPPYATSPPEVKLHQDSIEPKSRFMDPIRPPGPPELTIELSPPELPSDPAPRVVSSVTAPETQHEATMPQVGAQQGDHETPQASPPSGGSVFSDLDDLVSKLGSRRKTSSAYAVPRPPRPQSFSKRHAATVPAVPELPSNPSLAPKFNTFELSTSDSVRRPKQQVLEAPKVYEPNPATHFELSSSDSVVRRPKSSSITTLNKHAPLEAPYATHFELSTSPSVLRRPKSQNFASPLNSAPLKPPPSTHFELSTSDSVMRRPKSQNFVPVRYNAEADRKSDPLSTTVPQGPWFERWQENFEANQKFDLPMVPQRQSHQ